MSAVPDDPQVEPLAARVAELERQLAEARDATGEFPAGHYYSPIPDRDELAAHLADYEPGHAVLPEIDLRAEHQRALVERFGAHYAELPFPQQASADCRYHYRQEWFGHADAIFLYSMLRTHRPRTVIEVGSGFSSAVMLETTERFLPDTTLTFLEPHTERLRGLLRDGDKQRCTILEQRVQDVPLETFASLGPGDLLFIDSSHVLKCGSDLQLLMFEVLPHLPEGVFVHFHDIFYPFEYPQAWLEQGKYWNEGYMLRAFLANNRDWSIHAWSHYASYVLRDAISALCLENPGGSLYLQRTART
jgi:predicted O-methyltransferase YrrM